MKNIYRGILLGFVLLVAPVVGWGQQIIGSFPYMNGGFEGQTVAPLLTNLSSTDWTRQNQAGSSSGIVTTNPRSGSNHATVASSLTVSRNLQSPQGTIGGPEANTSYIVQFFIKNSATIASFQGGITTNGTANPTYSTVGTLAINPTWVKQTYILSTASTTVTSNGIGIAGRSGTGTFDVDDYVIYQGAAPDVSSPNSPLSVTINNSTTTSLDVNWSAPLTGDVDGGGYVVIRYASIPNGDNDPNQNGIYAVGNTHVNGTGGLIGIIRYIGTGTAFTDNVGLSDGAQYWYKVYTVDKAFNYSDETLATGTTVSAGYPITVSQAPGGAISPGTTSVAPGGSQPFTATAYPCYEFTNWIVDNSNVGSANPYVFLNVAAPHSITALYTGTAPTTPTALSASNVGTNSFTANWNAVAGATGYYVDVYTNGPLASDLFISEYVEGTSNNKYIEIFNGTGTSINLSDYRIELYSNGSSSASATMNLTGMLGNNAVAVYQNASATLYSGSATTNSTVLVFNGDDGLVLRKISTNNVVDIFGRTGEDPGAAWVSGSFRTDDKTLVRKSSLASGISTNPSSGFPTLGTEWDQYNTDDVSHLGTHAFSGGLIYVPGFQDIFVTTNSIDVTGLNPGTSYYYVVRSFNGTCASPNSNVMPVPSAAACSATSFVNSFLPATGPVGTMVTIRGTGFSTTPATNGVQFGELFSTSYTRQGDTIIIAEVPAGVSSGSVIRVSNAITCWGSSASTFTLISTTGSCTMSDLIISEVFDPASGNNHYIEIFNGTSSSINLNSPNNYTIQVWNNPSATNTFDINGIIAPGQVKVYYAGTDGGLASSPPQGAGVGFNDDDEIRLLKNGVVIDRMVAPGNTGYNWRRSNSIAGPNSNYTASEWNVKEETDGNLAINNIGLFSGATNLAFTTHPADQTCTFSMSAVATGSITAYQWLFFDPSDSTWKNVNLANLPGTQQPVGAQTSSLTITGNIAPYINYQFYLETRNGSSCSRASNTAQFEYLTKAYYKANVAVGDWTTAGSWLMSDNINSGYGATCTYPVASNSQVVIIPAGTKINHSTNLSISIDKLHVETGGELEMGSAAGLKILNGVPGEDLLVDGTLLDRTGSGGGNGISFEDNTGLVNDAGWKLGAYGHIIKTNSSGASNYRDFYETGIANIPATARWTYRHDNLSSSIGFASSTADMVMYYPNLTLENTVIGNTYSSGFNASAPNLSTFTMTGANNPVIIKGNFDVGGSGSGFINFLNINSSATVKINGNMNVRQGNMLTNFGNPANVGTGFDLKGNLTVDGTLSNNGNSTDQGMLRFSGTSNQIISGSGLMNMEDIDINNSTGANVIVAKSFGIPGTLSFGSSGKLYLDTGNITLKSSIARTANVGIIPVNNAIGYNTGRFIVERYINTGIGHERTWQFLATPTSGQTIRDSWQEGGNNTITGYGTRITGPAVAGGIDDETFAPSLKTFNSNTNLWDGIANTNATQVYNGKGYMLFVRGDRTSIVSPTFQPPAVPTVLRTTGMIHQPSAAPAAISIAANQFASVGNPYASPISVPYLFANTASNLQQYLAAWDPTLYGAYGVGGYQTISPALNYIPTPAGTSAYPAIEFKDIQSGQAFFVQAAAGGTGTISFNENVKSSNDRLVNFAPGLTSGTSAVNGFLPTSNPRNRQIFRTSLYTAGGIVADGNGVAFDHDYENTIDAHDAAKLWNGGENFAISRSGHWLAVEARAPIEKTDTIFYSMYNLRRQDYQLRFAPENMHRNLTAYLVDIFLNNRTQLSITDSSFVDIRITEDAGSARPDRFYVVFVPRKKVIPSNYPRRKINESNPFVSRDHVNTSLSVYPHPVADKKMNLQINGIDPGTYTLELNNHRGQPVFKIILQVNDKMENKLIQLPRSLPAGYYQLILGGSVRAYSITVVLL